jgi:hypothetical protein
VVPVNTRSGVGEHVLTRNSVYTYKEWSGRTFLDQEWKKGAVFIRVLYVLRKVTGYGRKNKF